MSKHEFLNIMRESLNNEIPNNEIDNNIKFYDEYIANSIKGNKTEEMVLNELGDARLISKTIIETYKMSNGERKSVDKEYYSNEDYSDDYNEKSNNKNKKRGFNINYDANKGFDIRFGRLSLSTWYGKLILGFAAMFIIIGILIVGGYILRILLPFIFIAILITLIARLFK